jgi:hypothetical protein
MSDLIAVAYPDRDTAEEVRRTLVRPRQGSQPRAGRGLNHGDRPDGDRGISRNRARAAPRC